MKKVIQFVSDHLNDDISRLILNKDRWPEVDIDMAIACIESRKKLKGKVQEWSENPELVFPAKLSAEQCSSSATGRYKAQLAERIAACEGQKPWRLADLTGGLGVDSWFFSQRAEKVLYNEMKTILCEAARHNFKTLGADITVSNHAICPKGENMEGGISADELLGDFRPDIIYMDPARRGEGGKKVFLIEECTPDVLTLKDELFAISRHILIKLSPMADITMVCNRLGKNCREVHVVAAESECKELLIWMDREWEGEYTIHAVELHHDAAEVFMFLPSEERNNRPFMAMDEPLQGKYLFEPGKALMKAGAFNTISMELKLKKLGMSTHYYILEEAEVEKAGRYGKIFRIKEHHSLGKRAIKAVGKDYPKSEVTARNLPMNTDALRKKLGITSGDDAHIFGLKSDSAGNLLMVTERV